MGRIVFLTNIDRQYVMMEQAGKLLSAEKRLPVQSQVVFFERNNDLGSKLGKSFFRESACCSI